MDFVDYYKILQLPRTANKDDIKTAYRQLTKTIHPDKNQEDNQATLNFQNLNDAYSTLSDIRKRRVYDIEYERQTRPYIPPVFTKVRTSESTNENTTPFPKTVRSERIQIEQFIRQFKFCVSKAEKEARIQKRRIKHKEEAVRVLEDEIFTAGFEMIEIHDCGAGPSNLERERTKEYPRVQAQEKLKVELEADLKEEEEMLASIEKQVLEFSSRLSYWENQYYGDNCGP